MTTSKWIASALVAALALTGGMTWAAGQGDTKGQTGTQGSQPAASPASGAPQKLVGEVVVIDVPGGMMTIRTDDGQTHQFRGSADTLREYKVGDRVEANLRSQSQR